MTDREICDKFEAVWKKATSDVSTGSAAPDLKSFVTKNSIEDATTQRRLVEIDQWYRTKNDCELNSNYYREALGTSDEGATTDFGGKKVVINDAKKRFGSSTEVPPLRCPYCLSLTLTVTQEADSFRCSSQSCAKQFELTPSDKPVLARVSHYEIVGLLGQGGFGRVWLANDKLHQTYVALKIPRQKLSDEMADRFLQEVRADYSLLEDPRAVDRIPQLHNWGRDGDISFVAFKFSNALPLSDVAGKRGLKPRRAAEIAMEIAKTLQIAHDNHVIHRDIKPANILMQGDQPLLIDFGIAKLRDESLKSDLETKGFMGTLSYASPEQSDSGAMDERSDIFSLGIVLFELLTGRRPFKGKDNLMTFVEIADVKKSAPKVSEFIPGIAPELESIVAKCLEKNPSNRYHSAGEMAVALAAFLGESYDVMDTRQQSQNVSATRNNGGSSQSSTAAAPPRTMIISVISMLVVAVLLVTLWATGWFEKSPPQSNAHKIQPSTAIRDDIFLIKRHFQVAK